MIRAFEVIRKGDKYHFFLRGMECMSIDRELVQKDRNILHRMVDRLHNELHHVLKDIEARPEAFGELLAEYNGVKT